MIKALLSQYPPERSYPQNGNNFISALKNRIVRLENEIIFKKKELETKSQLISTLISTQLLTQKR